MSIPGAIVDPIEELILLEQQDIRFAPIKISTPDGFVSGKWWGPRNIRPILCLHGWMDNCGSFDRLVPLLPTSYSYLTIDLPGHGRSSRYAPGRSYSYYDILILIERIRKQFDWPLVSLMGHSFGSVCCSMYAAVFPESTDLIICLDNFTAIASNAVEKIRTGIDLLLESEEEIAKESDKECPPSSYSEMIQRVIQMSKGSISEETAPFLIPRSVQESSKLPKKYFLNFDQRLKGMAMFFADKELRWLIIKSTPCPVLFLIGRESYMRRYPMIPKLEEIARQKTNFFFHWGPGNHHFLLSHPEAYVGEISKFLQSYRPPNAKL